MSFIDNFPKKKYLDQPDSNVMNEVVKLKSRTL